MEQNEINDHSNQNPNNQIILPIFFPTAPSKLIIMSICTFGIYEFYWFYKNWKYLKQKDSLNISPFWRAWFSIFFCYSLFKNVKNYSNKNNIQEPFSPGWLATAFIIIFITWKLPDPAWLFSSFTFLPLLTIQNTINILNQNQIEKVINKKLSGWNIFAIIFGVIFWALIILGMFLPE